MTTVHMSPPPLSPQSMADLLCTIVLLCQGKNANGRPFWAYMAIKPSMAEAFKAVRDAGGFNLEDYGTIIEYGEGSAVPANIRTQMERDYGVKHDYEEQLLAAIREMKRKEPA